MQIASSVSRRHAILGTLAGTLALASTAVAGESGSHDGHGSHDGGDAGPHHKALFDSAMECVGRGEACVPHCIALIAKGDTSLAACLASVQQMLPTCTALARFAAHDAPRLKQLAEFCIGVCEDCEKECRKHERHDICRQCAESCAACAKECKALLKT